MSSKKKGSKSSGGSVESVFNKYADEDDPLIIDVVGIGSICEEVGIDAEDIAALMLVWKLGAKAVKPQCITKEEFLQGMERYGLNSINDIKQILPQLDPGFLDQSEFLEFYRFVFKFNLEGTKRTIDKETIAMLLPIVIDTNRAPHLNEFIEFLGLEECKHPHITLDQWTQFLQFEKQMNQDLSNFDDNDAWPLLLDEFVDWMRENKLKA